MKKLWQTWRCQAEARELARFGQARLVVTKGGRMELRGGSAADVAEAREWISLFMHEAVPVLAPGPGPGKTEPASPVNRVRTPSRRPSAFVGAPG